MSLSVKISHLTTYRSTDLNLTLESTDPLRPTVSTGQMLLRCTLRPAVNKLLVSDLVFAVTMMLYLVMVSDCNVSFVVACRKLDLISDIVIYEHKYCAH